MKATTSTPSIVPPQPEQSSADRLAHELASFVRRVEPTPDLPPLPTEPDERRRVMKVRGW